MRSRPRVEILERLVSVEPGQSATANLRVRNTGNEVAQYTVELVESCSARAWTQAVPAQFSLLPGDDQDVCLYFQPPLDSRTVAGAQRYAVRVIPDREEQDPSVEEAEIVVGGVHALDVHVRPPHATGRRRGRYRVRFENRGTETVRVALGVDDAKEALGFAYTPASVEVHPGGSAEAFLEVRSRSPKLTGKPTSHPFAVIWRRKAGGPSDVGALGLPVGGEIEARRDVTYEQLALIPKAAFAVAALVVALVGFLSLRTGGEEQAAAAPPRPPQDFVVNPGEDGAFDVKWSQSGASTRAKVQVRQVECTAENKLNPDSIGDVADFETGETGTFTPTNPVIPNETVCFQIRSLADDGRGSVWFPIPPEFRQVIVPDDTLPSPVDVQAKDLGDGRAEITWTTPAVQNGRELSYLVLVDGQPNGDPYDAPPARFPLEGGRSYEIAVKSVDKNDTQRQSTAVAFDGTLDMQEPVDGSGDGGDGSAGGGSESPQTAGYGNFWIYFEGPDPSLDTTRLTQWRAYASEAGWPIGEPQLYTIGDTITPMPLTGGGGSDGDLLILSVDLDTEDEAVSRCGDLVPVFERYRSQIAGLRCVVFDSDGETRFDSAEAEAEPAE